MKNLKEFEPIHIVGVGGIGMSAIAEVLHSNGVEVRGSDLKDGVNTRRLAAKGIPVAIGQRADNIEGARLVVLSSAVKEGNPERAAAIAAGLPVWCRAEMLARLMENYKTVSVTGTHGKTTTTSMIAWIFEQAGLDPTVITGGIVNDWGTNARIGEGEWFIVEADESDETFVKLPTHIGVVTNIDPEHLDYYGSVDAMYDAYKRFFAGIRPGGAVVAGIDHPVVREFAEGAPLSAGSRLLKYGAAADADVRLAAVRSNGGSLHADAVLGGAVNGGERRFDDLTLAAPGHYNALNAMAAIAVATEAGIDDASIRAALESFHGVKRRFTRAGVWNGVPIYDDYAHHPTEISAVLEAARGATAGRVIAIVQPHRYSRLKSLFEEFSDCFRALGHADRHAGLFGRRGAERRRPGQADPGRAPARPPPGDRRGRRGAAHQSDRLAGQARRSGDRHGRGHHFRMDQRAPRQARPDGIAARRGRVAANHPDWDVAMSFPDLTAELQAILPDLRGRLEANRPMADITWFRVGGPAQLLFSPADEADLAYFFQHVPGDLPVTVVGVGSNLLVRDGGIPGVVIRLGRGFGKIEPEDGARIRVGTAVPDMRLAQGAASAGIAGLEFYRGIPGTVGGALRMNAGAHGTETKDVLVEARAVDRFGAIHVLSLADLAYTYRHCGAPEDLIFTEALYQGTPGDPDAIARAMQEVTDYRETHQPVKARTGGSTFKNPPGNSSWKLIDAAGLRGFRVGGAHVSEKHCNFLINDGEASAEDIETLGETVRARVKAQSGIELEWEIKRLGVPAEGRPRVVVAA